MDCLSCGACCASADGGTCCPVTAADRSRLGWLHARRLMDKRTDKAGLVGSLRIEWRPHPPGPLCQCVALEGRINERVRCTIYRRRPQACRDLQPDTEDCRQFRRRIGMKGED